MTYARDTRLRQERDRVAWAGETQVLMEAERTGSGQRESETIQFGVVFEGRPFFTWHVELLEGSLVAGDYPVVNAFVTDWDTTELNDRVTLFRGARIATVVTASTSYHLGFMLSFVGTAYKGPLA